MANKNLFTDKVEITVTTLIEARRAFRALQEYKGSYIHRVYADDNVFEAMAEIEKTHKDYFGNEAESEPVKPELNPIERAYEDWVKIRKKNWPKPQWIKKYSETEVIADNCAIWPKADWNFISNPEDWEIYTEPKATPSSQPTFDRNRFEAMLRAVIAIGRPVSWEEDIKSTEALLQQLDAYYASKEGGKHE